MDADTVQVTVNGKIYEYPAGVSYREITADFQPRYENDIVLVIADGKLRELHKRCRKNCQLEMITTAEQAGKKAYERSMTLLMLKAVYDVAGKERVDRVRVEFSMQEGLYCTMKGEQGPTIEFLEQVEERMRRLCQEDIPIMKRSVGTDEAIRLFREHGMMDKVRLFHYRRGSKVNIYSIGGFEDYYYGYMVASTGYLKYFALHQYKDGFVLQLTSKDPRPFIPMRSCLL